MSEAEAGVGDIIGDGSIVVIGKHRVTVVPGRLFIVKVAFEESSEGGLIAVSSAAQAQHGEKLGIHFPMGWVMGIGPVDPSIQHDAERFKFTQVNDLVWYDYRQAGHIMLAGKDYYFVPRQSVVGKVELDIPVQPAPVPAPQE